MEHMFAWMEVNVIQITKETQNDEKKTILQLNENR